MPHPTIDPASATVNGKLYCIDGANRAAFTDVDFFDYVQIYQP